MGEQNRRAVEMEGRPADSAAVRPARAAARRDTAPGEADRALGPEADERQTERQAPPNASPGESADGDSIG